MQNKKTRKRENITKRGTEKENTKKETLGKSAKSSSNENKIKANQQKVKNISSSKRTKKRVQTKK